MLGIHFDRQLDWRAQISAALAARDHRLDSRDGATDRAVRGRPRQGAAAMSVVLVHRANKGLGYETPVN